MTLQLKHKTVPPFPCPSTRGRSCSSSIRPPSAVLRRSTKSWRPCTGNSRTKAWLSWTSPATSSEPRLPAAMPKSTNSARGNTTFPSRSLPRLMSTVRMPLRCSPGSSPGRDSRASATGPRRRPWMGCWPRKTRITRTTAGGPILLRPVPPAPVPSRRKRPRGYCCFRSDGRGRCSAGPRARFV